jgi:fatty acid desaturase
MGGNRIEMGAAPIAMSFGEERNLVLRWFAGAVALASTFAVAVVGLLSFGAYGAVTLLGRAGPLRAAYETFSSAYDRLIVWLGHRVLRDPRDAPALRLIVSATFSALPLLLVQLALGRLRLLLAVAFYLALYGLKFQRLVRMFSVKHQEAHRRQGYFSEKYDSVFGRYVEFFLGYLYGNVPELDRTVHVRLHHRENGGPDDTTFPGDYDRTSLLDFLRYLTENTWTVLGVAPYAYFVARGEDANRKRLLRGIVRFAIFFAAVFTYDWRIGIAFALVPLLVMNFITALTSWVQHAFYDTERPNDYFANTVTVYDEVNFMNEGYHLCHHHRSGLHWSEMPTHHNRIREKMRESGSLVFRDLDFIELFAALTLFRRMDVLAAKLVTWEPMSSEEKLALLAKRTKPARASWNEAPETAARSYAAD